MTRTVRGKTIELDEDLCVARGQEVEVQVTIVQPLRKWGEGIQCSAGGWVGLPGMGAIMENSAGAKIGAAASEGRQMSHLVDSNGGLAHAPSLEVTP